MKWLPLFFLALLSCPAFAEPVAVKPLPQKPSNVVMVDGKRFYSLQGVHRFHGSVDSPKALSVMHYPRQEGVVTGPRNPGAPFAAIPAPAGTTPSALTPSPAGTPQAADTSQKLLSIFSPEDKSISTPLTKQ